MSFKIRFCTSLAIMAIAVGTTHAVPYASKIRAADTTFSTGLGTDITYILNEPADSVTIEIQDAGTNAVVATFAGQTNRGENTVTWNGRVDNDAGAAVPQGGYRIAITANKSNTAWADVTSQRSLAAVAPEAVYTQVYNAFSPNDMLFVTDTDSDHFGRSWANSSYSWTPSPTVASVEFRADLAVADGTSGLDSRVMRMSPYDGVQGPSSSAYSAYFWGGSLDPEASDVFYYTGQTEPTFWSVDLDELTLVNADPDNHLGGNLPRSVLVVSESGAKYAYFCIGYTIQKAPMLGTQLSGAPVIVADFTTDLRYSRQVRVDSDGNLYWVSRGTGTGTATTAGQNGRLFRWNHADTLGPAPILNAANAAWEVQAAGDMQFMSGPAISPTTGDVFVSFSNGSSSAPAATNGVYLVGNKSAASIQKTLSTTDRIIDLVGLGWHISNIYSQLRFDPAGNLIVVDRQKEQIHAFTPGGQSALEIVAPVSQTLTIEPPSNVADWSAY